MVVGGFTERVRFTDISAKVRGRASMKETCRS